MFCMGCGAEIRPHAQACSVCGRPVSEPAPSAAQLATGRAPSTALQTAPPRAPAPVPPPPPLPLARPATPSIEYGDTRLLSIPRDAAGRLVLVLSLLLAADLFAPWIALDGTHVAPSRFSLATLLLLALFAASAIVALYAPFRQAPYYAAFPAVLGAVTFGASALLALLAGPLSSTLTDALVAHVLASPAINGNLLVDPQSPPTLALAADTGLYVFLIGAGILTVSGFQLIIAAANFRPALASQPVAAAVTGMGTGQGTAAPTADIATEGGGGATSDSVRGDGASATATATIDGSRVAAVTSGPANPASVAAPAVILPGSEEWSRAPQAPSVARNAPPLRGLGAQGMRGGRK